MRDSIDGADDPLIPTGQLRSLQIIAGALPAGVILFLMVALYTVFSRQNPQPGLPQDGLPILSLLSFLFLCTGFVMAVLVPRTMLRTILQQILNGTWQPPRQSDPLAFDSVAAKLRAARLTTLIVTLALAEGPAFFGCIAFMIEGHPLALVAVGVALAFMFSQFPTRLRVRNWLESQEAALEEMRRRE